MHPLRPVLCAALLCFPLIAADGQSAVLNAPAPGASTLLVTTVRVGGTATVQSEDGQFRILAERFEIASATHSPGSAGTIILEALEPGQDITLRVTPPGAAEPVAFVATRFTLTRNTESNEVLIRGENRLAP